MAAAASKKETVPLSFTFHGSEQFGSGGRTFHHGHAGLGGRSLGRKMKYREDEGLEEVLCGSGILESSGRLLFGEQVVVDMRMVCPQDVKKMLLKQARCV